MTQLRGEITDRIRDKSIEVLGYEITLTELRLMPYIQYVMVNSQRLNPQKINRDERYILAKWRGKGWIEGGASDMEITKKFWDAINEIIFLAYVDIDE